MFNNAQLGVAGDVLDACRRADLKLATAESCTGGLIAGCLTAVAGSSDVFERGFVVYSDQSKTDLLNVPVDLIEKYGAVSEEVARAMVRGVLDRTPVKLAVATTGIAGPAGGSALKPVGLVHIAAARAGQAIRCEECRFGDIGRDAVRMKSVDAALRLLHTLL